MYFYMFLVSFLFAFSFINAKELLNHDSTSKEARAIHDKSHEKLQRKYKIKALAYPFSIHERPEVNKLETSSLWQEYLLAIEECIDLGILPTSYEVPDRIYDKVRYGVCLALCDYVLAKRLENPDAPIPELVEASIENAHDVALLQQAHHIIIETTRLKISLQLEKALDKLYKKFVFSEKYAKKSPKSIMAKVKAVTDGETLVAKAVKKAFEFCKEEQIHDLSDSRFQQIRTELLHKLCHKYLDIDAPLASKEAKTTVSLCKKKLTALRDNYLHFKEKELPPTKMYDPEDPQENAKLNRKIDQYLNGTASGALRIIYLGKHNGHIITVFKEKEALYLLDQNTGLFMAKDKDKEQLIKLLKKKLLTSDYSEGLLGYTESELEIQWVPYRS